MIKKLHTQFKKIELSEQEAQNIRQQVLLHMEKNPVVRDTEGNRRTTGKSHGLRSLFLLKRPMFVSIILALVAMVGGGTAFAAESTIPGDLLYPVKVHINENARTALAGSTEAKAKLEARFAERRMEEAAKLEQKGELKTDVVIRLESNLSAHIDKAEQHITRLTEEGKLEAAAEAQARLEASIRVHQTVLEKLRAKRIEVKERLDAKAGVKANSSTPKNDDEEDDEDAIGNTTSTNNSNDGSSTTTPKLPFVRPVDRILKALEHRLEVQEEVREKISERLEESGEEKIRSATLRAKKSAENKMEETRKMIAKFVEKQGPQPRAQAEFNAAVAVKVDADAKLSNNKFREAFELYHKAQQMFLNAKILLQEKFDTEVEDENETTDVVEDGEQVNERKNKERDAKKENNNDKREEKEDNKKIKTDERIEVEVDLDLDDNSVKGRGGLNLNIGVN